VADGAKILLPVENQFWGDRNGWVMDPSGHWKTFPRASKRLPKERDSAVGLTSWRGGMPVRLRNLLR
jgi:hypothetical protein